jgi:CHAT domain-containing protein
LAAHRQAVATLRELRGQLTRQSSGAQATFRRQVEPVYHDLVDLLLTPVSDIGREPEVTQLSLAEARSTLEELRAAELRDYFRDECLDAQRKATPDDIPGTLVVYPIPLPDRLELIVSVSGRLAHYVSSVDRDTLEFEAREFRRLVVKRTTWQFLDSSRKLYDWLIRPLHPILDGRPIDTLVFVPGGALRTIPLAALQDRETRRFLVERVPLAVVPSLTLTDPKPIARENVRLLASGISNAVLGYRALENVDREIEFVSRAFPGETLINDQFKVAEFEKQIAEQPYGIVHIASHAEFSADASQSYLVTYDRKLPMDELAKIIEQARFRDQPLELLMLSACETAAGDERAALGLAGVALRAGARSAVGTLWSVDDEASADLVTRFYQELGNPARSRAQALQRAQLALLETRTYRHPIYWSPFLLISSWL